MRVQLDSRFEWLVPRLHGPLILYSVFGILYLALEIADQYAAKLVFKGLLMPTLAGMLFSWHRELPLTPTVWLVLVYAFAWGGDLSLGLGTTAAGLCFFTVSRLFLLAAFRWYDQLNCAKILVSSAFYSGSVIGMQVVIWQSESQPVGMQIAALFYILLVGVNGYFFTKASWTVLIAGLLFAFSDALIGVRLFDSDWAGLAELDIVAYVLAMAMFGYDYVTGQLDELKSRGSAATVEAPLIGEDNESAEELTNAEIERIYEFKEQDTAI